jgi:glycosyltransferase involved in cell wall biosynthesis
VYEQIDSLNTVTRTYPGPFVSLSSWLSEKISKSPADGVVARPEAGESPFEKVYRFLRNGLDVLLFPDVRTEWYPFARNAIRRLHKSSFDLVLASHEPGVDLMLGMHAARKMSLPLVVDLADPLVTPYSPRWRRKLDHRLERKTCQAAAGVITTSPEFARDLRKNYGLSERKITVIEQGFREARSNTQQELSRVASLDLPKNRFWIFFSGNFYQDFRNPKVLLSALKTRPEISLVYAGSTPDWLMRLIGPLGRQIRCLGRLSHEDTLAVQRAAPALLNLGNQQARQVPGKIFEYLGARRPVLHVALNEADESGSLLDRCGRGIAVKNDPEEICAALDRLGSSWTNGSLSSDWDLSAEAVNEFSWDQLANRLTIFLKDRLANDR